MDEEGQQLVCLKGSKGDLSMEVEIVDSEVLEADLQAEELNEQIDRINLAEQEKRRAVKIEDEDIIEINRDFTNMAACKILSNKMVNQEMFMDKIPRIWGLEGRVGL